MVRTADASGVRATLPRSVVSCLVSLWTSVALSCAADDHTNGSSSDLVVWQNDTIVDGALHTWHGTDEGLEAGRGLAGSQDFVFVGAPGPSYEGEISSAFLLDPSAPDGPLLQAASFSVLRDRGEPLGHAAAIQSNVVAISGIVSVVDEHRSVGTYPIDASGQIPATEPIAYVSYRPGEQGPIVPTHCGDINGDTIEDTCVGSIIALHSIRSEIGIQYGPWEGGVAFDDVSVRLIAPLEERAGQHIAGGSDLTGDDADDLLVGAFARDNFKGGVYLVSSPSMGEVSLDAFPLWTGEAPGDHAGAALAAGGDLDGDGAADFFVGAHLRDGRQGGGYVVTETAEGGPLAQASIQLTGPSDSSFFGFSATIGDFNHDGNDDLAVGIPEDFPFGLQRPGRVAVYFGPLQSGNLPAAEADLLLAANNTPTGDGFGTTLATVGTPGAEMLVVGAPFDSSAGPATGRVYLYDVEALLP